MKNKAKLISYSCAMIYFIFWLFKFYQISQVNFEGLGMLLVAAITPLIVPILFNILHLKAVYEIYTLSTSFTFAASLLGSCYHFYSYPGFDKVVHFCSGLLFLSFAVLLYYTIMGSNQITDQEHMKIFIIFALAVNMSIALLWEFYEYSMLVFFNNDCINHYTSGVHDSITDMLCATVAGLLLIFSFINYHKKGKRSFFVDLTNKFYELNIKK